MGYQHSRIGSIIDMPSMALCVPLIAFITRLNTGHYAALMTLYEAPMRKAQRRIEKHGWDTKVDTPRVYY